MSEEQKKKRKPVHEMIKEILSTNLGAYGFVTLARIYIHGGIIPKEAVPGMIEAIQKAGEKTGEQAIAGIAIQALKEQEKEAKEVPKREKGKSKGS